MLYALEVNQVFFGLLELAPMQEMTNEKNFQAYKSHILALSEKQSGIWSQITLNLHVMSQVSDLAAVNSVRVFLWLTNWQSTIIECKRR